jgi:NADPH:quinone reductase-like Zn-dependent oxidoreductase
VIVDLVGAAYAEKNAASLAVLGRHVVVGLVGGAKANVDFGRLIMRRHSLLGLVMRSRPLLDKIAVVERFRRQWLAHFDDGRLVPRVDRVFPFAEVAAAHAYLETNASVGKVVLSLPSA